MPKYLSMTNPTESDDAKRLRCLESYNSLKGTPKAPVNRNQWAKLWNVAWGTARDYLKGTPSTIGFEAQDEITNLIIEVVPDNWIPVDTGYTPTGDRFTGLQDVRDTLQTIANEAMNVVDDCNGTIIAIDAVLTVMQSEARVTMLEATVKSLNNRLYLAEDSNVKLKAEIQAEKERLRLEKMSKSSQG